jgi:hypothetical protein
VAYLFNAFEQVDVIPVGNAAGEYPLRQARPEFTLAATQIDGG